MKELFTNDCVRILTDAEVRSMVGILAIGSLDKPVKAADLFSDMEHIPSIVKIMVARLALTDLEFAPGLVAFLSDLSEGIPGRVVMLAHALVKATRSKGQSVTMELFMKDVCPMGLPTEEHFEHVWSSQKLPNGQNFLDTMEAWQ